MYVSSNWGEGRAGGGPAVACLSQAWVWGQPGSACGQLKHLRAQTASNDDSFLLFAVLVF